MKRGYAPTKIGRESLTNLKIPVVYDNLIDALNSLRTGDIFVVPQGTDGRTLNRVKHTGCTLEYVPI